jgi:hypothetical protein
MLRVVRGLAEPDEIAALVTVVTALAARSSESNGSTRPGSNLEGWRNRSALLRPDLHPGPGAWRASSRPH